MKPKFPLPALCAVASLTSVHAATIDLTAADALGNSSFNTAGNWSDTAAPVAGNDYVVALSRLRTPTASESHTFSGDSLTLTTTDGNLSYKTVGSHTITIDHLILDGGLVDHLQGATEVFTLAGNIEITSTGSRISATQGAINITAPINGDGDVTFIGGTAAYGTTLSAASTLTGNIIVNGFLTAASESSLSFHIGSNGVNNTLGGTGTAAFHGTFHIDLTQADQTAGNSWTLVDAATLTESFGSTFNIPGFTKNGAAWIHDSGTYLFSETTGVLTIPQADSDGDGLPDLWEYINLGNLDRSPDDDPDQDYATHAEEHAAQTNPLDRQSFPDADAGGTGDGMADAWETLHFGNTNATPGADDDGDSYTNLEEFLANTSPSDSEWTPDQAKLRHRWSFNGNLDDSVGSQTAQLIEPDEDPAIGGAANLAADAIILAGGPHDTSAYIDLGPDLISGRKHPVTLELWATHLSAQNWSRIFDIGSGTTDYLFMSWNRGGTATNTDRVEWVGLTNQGVSDSVQPYTLGTEFHIIMTIEPGLGTDSSTLVSWYARPVGTSDLGFARGSFSTTNQLTRLDDAVAYLGRSQWAGDATANARYNEVRVWDGALTSAEREFLHDAGPQVINASDSDGDGLPDAWEIANFRSNPTETSVEILAKYLGEDDPDGDLSDNLSEFQDNTDPNNIFSSFDSDSDGLADGYEIAWFRQTPDEDLFTITAKYSGTDDPDGDGFNNLTEFAASTPTEPGGTDPNDAAHTPLDQDRDGLIDSWEMFHFENLDQPTSGDPDQDGISNLLEQNAGSDPTVAASVSTDTNGNGIPDTNEPFQPYATDSHTLHLWHLDEVKAAASDSGSDPINLAALANGAVLWSPSLPGFGTGLNTAAGRGTATSGVLSAFPLTADASDDTPMSYAGEDGAFTFEALLRVDFDPAAPLNPGVPMQIVSGEGDAAANRVWQFRIVPTAGAPRVEFINLNGEVAVATFPAPIPIDGPHAIAQGSWYHLAVTYDGLEETADNLRFYWTLVAPSSTAANPIGAFQMATDLITAAPDFTIGNEGRSTGGTTDNFNGVIDEVRISSIARTPSQFIFTHRGTEGDSDGDGLADSWEINWFTDLTQTAGGDFDGDGTDNLTEFRLGLIPTNSTSRFAITSSASGQLQWPSADEISFTVLRSTDLVNWTSIATVAGTAETAEFTDPEPPTTKAFYRIRMAP